MPPVDKSQLKDALLKTLVEKGDYATIATILREDDKADEGNKLTKLITPISAFADLLTENSKGAFMEDLEKRLDGRVDDITNAAMTEVRDAHDALKSELQAATEADRGSLSDEIATRITEANTTFETAIARYADLIVDRKAEEMFATLSDQARLSEDEIAQIVDDSALSVESQLQSVIGSYIAEQGITVDQIKDFSERVKALIPQVDFSKVSINWGQIRNAPSYGGTNVHTVKQMIDTAVADISGASTAAEVDFTPAGTIAATDVQAALEELDADIQSLSAGSGISRTVVVTSGSITVGSAAATDYVYFISGAHTMSLPAAAANTTRYTFKNNHSAAVTIDTVGAETIDGSASIQIAPEDAVDIISNGTNYNVV
jgi:hypothetical protein